MNALIKKYECCVCNNAVSLHENTTYTFCKNCNQWLAKTEVGTLEIQYLKTIEIANDYVKIGTKGVWQNKSFVVTGRCRLWFDSATENFWTILFDDRSVGFLREYVGFYSIITPRNIDLNKTDITVSTLTKNKSYKLSESEICTFNEKRETDYIDAEGEFGFPRFYDKITVYEFVYSGNKKILIVKFVFNESCVFLEELVSIDELSLTGINSSEIIYSDYKCQKCNNNIQVLDKANTKALSCQNCGNQYKVTRDKISLSGTNDIDRVDICFDLKDKLILDNIEYYIVGIAIKQDYSEYKSRWREYSLYNKIYGYAYLSEYNGHWIWLKESWSVEDIDLDNGNEFLTYDEKEFELFNKYTYQTIYAEGAFTYNLFDKNNITCYEYIAPPLMLSKEKYKTITTWFVGKHISKKEIEKQCNNALPFQTGIGAIEPKGSVKSSNLFIATLVMILIATGLHLLASSVKEEKELFNNNYYINDSTQVFNASITDLSLTQSSSNVILKINAPVSNSWIEVSAKLVNTKTGAEYNIDQGIEYYYGYEDGESWSEGSTTEQMHLSKIPSGNYVLNLQATQNSYNKVHDLYVSATYDTAIHRNWVLTLVFIIIFAIIIYGTSYYYDYKRWQDSPYFLNKYPSNNAS